MESSLLLINAGLLGLRHGIDWDHIAAISDIVGTTTSGQALSGQAETKQGEMVPRGRPLKLSSMYALGHATVVAILGLCAMYFAAILPGWIDPLMERVVGLTLLLLGVWVCISLVKYMQGKESFRLQSRWTLGLSLARSAWQHLATKITGRDHKTSDATTYGAKTAFGIGMMHGIGAETGSQMLLITSLGGASSHGLGPAMLVCFLAGLLLANTIVAAVGAAGFISSSKNKWLYLIAGILTCAFSLIIGTYFALGQGESLPDLQQLLGWK